MTLVMVGLSAASLAGCSTSTTSTTVTTTTSPGCARVIAANKTYTNAIEQTNATAASLASASAAMRSALEAAKATLPPHAAKQATYAAADLTTIEQHLQGSAQSSFATDLLAFHQTLKNLRTLCNDQG